MSSQWRAHENGLRSERPPILPLARVAPVCQHQAHRKWYLSQRTSSSAPPLALPVNIWVSTLQKLRTGGEVPVWKVAQFSSPRIVEADRMDYLCLAGHRLEVS